MKRYVESTECPGSLATVRWNGSTTLSTLQAAGSTIRASNPQATGHNQHLPGIPLKQVTHREANERHERRPESKIISTFCCIISSSRLLTQRLVQLHLAEHLEHLGVRSAAGA